MALVDWRPSLVDVATHIPTRTQTPEGEELGTFTAATRPTATQVELLIDHVVGELRTTAGALEAKFADDADELANQHADIRSVAAVCVAARVELGKVPEQVGGDVSPYDELAALCASGRASLAARLAPEAETAATATPSLPLYHFPAPISAEW